MKMFGFMFLTAIFAALVTAFFVAPKRDRNQIWNKKTRKMLIIFLSVVAAVCMAGMVSSAFTIKIF